MVRIEKTERQKTNPRKELCLTTNKHKEDLHMFMTEKEFTKNMNIQELDNSIILVAKKEIFVPDKKIVLLDEINEAEKHMLKNIGYTGGIVL